MSDPVGDIIGDYRAFAAQQNDRLLERGIDIAPYPLGHLAFRVPEWDWYVHLRGMLERHARASTENVWNGRPMSMILLEEPLRVLGDKEIPLIELIPPVHQRTYKMGMEHIGVVVGEEVDEFARRHREVLTGQQFQNHLNEPYYVLFEDFTHMKFHRRALKEVLELQGRTFEGIQHVEGWMPQRLVTATGPNPLPR
ncbi:VOC family protein [Agromyces arachidis]|uniref:VOC family protein n=1 Tax=Agromyces arachidis TaxID=766966 RepID=UPI0040567E02